MPAKPKSIPALEAEYQAAMKALRTALEEKYPTGTNWRIMVRSGQKTPSIMTVYSHSVHWQGEVRFERARPEKYGRWQPPYRVTVPTSQIIERV